MLLKIGSTNLRIRENLDSSLSPFVVFPRGSVNAVNAQQCRFHLANKKERNNAIATRYLESQRQKSVRKIP